MASKKRQAVLESPSKAKRAKIVPPKTGAKACKHAAETDPGTVKSKYLRCLAKPPSNVLWPHMMQFSGRFCGKQREMHELIKAHGGKIGSKKVFNLMVASVEEYEGKTNKVMQAEKKWVRIVHELYLYDTILNGSQPDINFYDWSNWKKGKGNSGSVGVTEEDEDDEDDDDNDDDDDDYKTPMREISPCISREKYGRAAIRTPSRVLAPYTITFSGKFSVSQKKIQDLAVGHGAKLGTKTKFNLLIASPDGYDCENAKVLQAEIIEAPILHELFLYDAIISGKVPGTDKYNLAQSGL